jgi:hypothetical protein
MTSILPAPSSLTRTRKRGRDSSRKPPYKSTSKSSLSSYYTKANYTITKLKAIGKSPFTIIT